MDFEKEEEIRNSGYFCDSMSIESDLRAFREEEKSELNKK